MFEMNCESSSRKSRAYEPLNHAQLLSACCQFQAIYSYLLSTRADWQLVTQRRIPRVSQPSLLKLCMCLMPHRNIDMRLSHCPAKATLDLQVHHAQLVPKGVVPTRQPLSILTIRV